MANEEADRGAAVLWCSGALAQSAQELIDNGKNPANVTTFGMGYHLNQYSPLKEINKSNIKRLVPVWATSLANDSRSGARQWNTSGRLRASAPPT